MPDRHSVFLFAGIGTSCLVGIALIAAWARTNSVSDYPESPLENVLLRQPLNEERLYFRYTGLGPEYGQLAFIDEGTSAVQFHPELSCEAVHAAGGRGICLSADRGVVTRYTAFVFDTSTHRVLGDFSLGGSPSRTRVSPGGRIAATTVFVTGHGYDSVDFSTQTMLYDLVSMETIADLETFKVVHEGEQVSRADFNFWGVTFSPDQQGFYATLSTAGEHYLVKGDVPSRTVVVINDRVECPSVSPDGSRIAFKRRVTLRSGAIGWNIYVLNVADGKETALADERSIDDQLEWLDNEHVLYSVPDPSSPAVTNVWIGRADGAGDVSLFLAGAYSPALVR